MRLCRNKITDIIRDHFQANPLKNPESRIQPLGVLEIIDNKPKFLGNFSYLVKGGLPLKPEVRTSLMPEISGIKTKKVVANFGISILENFLKAVKVDPGVVSASIRGFRQLSFSFENVQRLYIEPLQLGNILSEHELLGDTENIFVEAAIKNNDTQLAIITDAVISNNFSISTFKENNQDTAINFPVLSEYIGGLDLNVQIHKKAENEVQFEGEEFLTFAFSCVEIKIDPETGKFSRGDWLTNIRTAKGRVQEITEEISDADWNTHSKFLLDSNNANPLLIEL